MILLATLLAFTAVIGIYVALAIFLNKFHQIVYGKKTALAWIPICNVYLLGKLAINKVAGLTLIALIILTGKYSVTLNGITTTYTILPAKISNLIQAIYDLAIIVLLIYAIIEYNKLKNNSQSTTENKNSEAA